MSTRLNGQAYRSETFVFVQVSWPWLILPIGLPVFTILLLVTMVIVTRPQRVLWKSSVFPLLMSRLQLAEEHKIAHLHHLGQVETISKRVKVRISEEEDSLVFSEL
ncbi:hypothetical protein N7481_002378 [Penicillium waksmanii]|uniref:uncharacterized protein n=1 Tax=Penicillium waksmanii TaxID=69791 RepID=UPI00254685A2|nr:uncharacterized protein N7481_002378 [Penicillium waksmanii]KAJ5995401.1 hypothetical protein N7481_002378 [Penicillium waksmanii]